MEAVIGKITTMLKSKLHGLKGKAVEQGKRKVMKYKDKLPTEDQITEKLKNRDWYQKHSSLSIIKDKEIRSDSWLVWFNPSIFF